MPDSTEVLFSALHLGFIFFGEQFWGRAARAPVTRKSPGARYIWPLSGEKFLERFANEKGGAVRRLLRIRI